MLSNTCRLDCRVARLSTRLMIYLRPEPTIRGSFSPAYQRSLPHFTGRITMHSLAPAYQKVGLTPPHQHCTPPNPRSSVFQLFIYYNVSFSLLSLSLSLFLSLFLALYLQPFGYWPLVLVFTFHSLHPICFPHLSLKPLRDNEPYMPNAECLYLRTQDVPCSARELPSPAPASILHSSVPAKLQWTAEAAAR